MIKHKRVTLVPVGADGSAVDSVAVSHGKHGFIRAIKVDFQNQPATADLTITDGYGNVLFTNTSSNTDIALKNCANPGIDEGGAASAATDGASGGWGYISGFTVAVAQGDGQTSGDEKIIVDMLVEE